MLSWAVQHPRLCSLYLAPLFAHAAARVCWLLGRHSETCPATPTPPPLLPATACLQGNYSDLLVALSTVYSDLRGDAPAGQADEAAEVRGAWWAGTPRVLTSLLRVPRPPPGLCATVHMREPAPLRRLHALGCAPVPHESVAHTLRLGLTKAWQGCFPCRCAGLRAVYHQVLGAHERRLHGEAPHSAGGGARTPPPAPPPPLRARWDPPARAAPAPCLRVHAAAPRPGCPLRGLALLPGSLV